MNRTNTSFSILLGENVNRKDEMKIDQEGRNQEWDKENDSQNTMVSERELDCKKKIGFKQWRVEIGSKWKGEGEYVEDIRRYVRKLEESKRIGEALKEINVKKGNNYKYREQVIAYFIEMVAKYGYKKETLYLATTIYDKYSLVNQAEDEKEIQEIGVACLFIAGKYVQYMPPRLRKISLCSKQSHIVLRQHQILTQLNFNLTHYTICHHLEDLLQQYKISSDATKFSHFISDFTLFNYRIFALTQPQTLAYGVFYFICQFAKYQFPSSTCPFKLSSVQTISNNILTVFKHYFAKHMKLVEKINKDIRRNQYYQFK